MIGVGELVVVELVVVPLPGKLDVVGPGAERNVRPLALGDALGEGPGDAWTVISSPAPAQNRFGGLQSGQGCSGAGREGAGGTRGSPASLNDAQSSCRAWLEAGSGTATRAAAASARAPDLREYRMARVSQESGRGGPDEGPPRPRTMTLLGESSHCTLVQPRERRPGGAPKCNGSAAAGLPKLAGYTQPRPKPMDEGVPDAT